MDKLWRLIAQRKMLLGGRYIGEVEKYFMFFSRKLEMELQNT